MGDHFDDIETAIAEINKDYGLELKVTCMACPVQIEGEIGNKHLYFRARWEHWRLTIADTFDDAVCGKNTAYYKEEEYGGAFDASWMQPEDVSKEVRACLDQYLSA